MFTPVNSNGMRSSRLRTRNRRLCQLVIERLTCVRCYGSHGSSHTSAQCEVSSSLLATAAHTARVRALASEQAAKVHNGSVSPTPPLQRSWVTAPLSRLSSARTRRDWFRVMSFNTMADNWTVGCAATPVQGVQLRVPAFTRAREDAGKRQCDDGGDDDGHQHARAAANATHDNNNNNDDEDSNEDKDDARSNAGSFCDYDARVDAELPPFVQPEFRRSHLLTLLDYYDPDLVCLNEVSRAFFHDVLWRHVRYRGYGMLFGSSRGARVRASRHASEPRVQRAAATTSPRAAAPDAAPAATTTTAVHQRSHDGGKDEGTPSTLGGRRVHGTQPFLFVSPHEDIGNVVLFHKGRFCPILMPGHEVVRGLHYVHLVAMRDKVTNMTVNVACVQLTAGHSDEAAAVRRHEMRHVLALLADLAREDADRSHMTPLLCGDFNNTHDDDASVQLAREQLFSAYDVAGGPRWTTWFYADTAREAAYRQCYYARNMAHMHENSTPAARAQRQVTPPRTQVASQQPPTHATSTNTTTNTNCGLPPPVAVDTCQSSKSVCEHVCDGDDASATTSSYALQLHNALRSNGDNEVVCRTQDYIFYDPRTLCLHQVLDVPDDSEIDAEQALPCHKLPSHHLPLLIDVSYTDTYPDVAKRTTRP